jgi:hypothetical protein
MKKAIIFLVLLCFIGIAQAQTPNVTAGATVQSQGQAQADTNFAPTTYNGGTEYKVNTAIAPGLVAGFNTCLGSDVGALTVSTFSVAAGGTKPDDPCNLRSNSGQIFQMGDKAAAFALLCQNEDDNYAINVTGGITYRRADGKEVHRPCPMSKAQWIAAGRPLLDPVTGTTYTDPPLGPDLAKPVDPNVAVIEAHAAQLARAADAPVTTASK